MAHRKNKAYQAEVVDKLANGFTNTGDGKWVRDDKGREGNTVALLAAHKKRNKKSTGHVRPLTYKGKAPLWPSVTDKEGK